MAVLAPPEPYLADRDRNENSIVLELTHGRASFLLTGDAGHREETYLYWNRDRPVWNNDGDTITVIDAAGDDVLTEAYR